MKDAIAVALILASIGVLGGGSILNDFSDMKRENEALEVKIDQLQKENEALRNQLTGALMAN